MKNTKTTKRALLTSALALLLCVSMLVGSTFAWFTDSVTSAGNIIQSGKLDVEMYWAEGAKAVPADDSSEWTDASTGAIFNYSKWEPGFVQARHIKIANVGTLALSYQLRVVANGTVSKLADVIDVYYFDDATQLTRETASTGTKLGTLTEILGTDKNLSTTVCGDLLEKEEKTLTIAFKMQESADNAYQGLSIGTDFSVELIAVQHTYEKDSFNEFYDEDALSAAVPAALVRELEDKKINATIGIGGPVQEITLDTAYKFQPTQSYEELLESEYKYYLADFIVSADKDVPKDSIALAGYYNAWCQFNNDNWVAMVNEDLAVKAGQEIGLVKALGAAVHYKDICQYGNDGIGFLCGAADLTGENAGTTITVKLCLFETTADPNGSSASTDKVDGAEPIVIGEFKYTFPEKPYRVSNAEALQTALKKGKNVELTADIVDAPANTKAPYGNYYGVAQNGGVLNGNGKTLDFNIGQMHNSKYDNYGIMTSGGTIKNVTITGVFRGIVIMNPTEDIIIDNVTVGGDEDMCYGINTAEGDGKQNLIVTNSKLMGWNSIGNAVASATFTNCTFGQGTYYTDVYGRLVKPYVDTVFDGCEFNSKYYIDLSALANGCTITLKNCTVNGVKLTAENYKDLIVAENACGEGQITIESKSGTYAVADWIDYVTIQ